MVKSLCRNYYLNQQVPLLWLAGSPSWCNQDAQVNSA